MDAGLIESEDVSQLGDVLTGKAPGRQAPDEITLFDSTGLAIQDLAICQAIYERWRTAPSMRPLVSL